MKGVYVIVRHLARDLFIAKRYPARESRAEVKEVCLRRIVDSKLAAGYRYKLAATGMPCS